MPGKGKPFQKGHKGYKANLGRKFSDEVRKKMSEGKKKHPTKFWLGKKRSKETIDKIVKTTKERMNDTVRNKMSESAKKRFSIKKNHPRWKGGISQDWAHYNRERRNIKLNANGFHTFAEWELLKKQYGYICPSCKKSEPEIKLTEDHIIPLTKGGSDFIENIQPLCKSCNCKKHTKIIKYEKSI